MAFWIVVFTLALVVAALLILTMVRARQHGGKAKPAGGFDLQVYREQLREIERDLARGVIGKSDAERVRVEVSRRILAADARGQITTPEPDQSTSLARVVVVVMALLMVAGSATLYLELGAPGRADMGLKLRIELARQNHANRASQEQAEARLPPALPVEIDEDYKVLVDKLRVKAASQPDDLEGQVLLAQYEAQSGNLDAARAAQTRVIELMGNRAGAGEYARLGELLIVAANGYVSPQAEKALRAALERDQGHGSSRYYWGLMLIQNGRPDLAFRIWQSTLQQGPPDAPWLEPIREGIEEMAWRAGVDFTLPTAPMRTTSAAPLAGPTAGDMASAAEMAPQERQAMIRGMVNQLGDRLANEGGSPGEWAQMISALGTLGQKDRAQAIYNEAKTVFAGNDSALGEITVAAKNIGLD